MARLMYLFFILLSQAACTQNSIKAVQITLDKQVEAARKAGL